MTHADPEPAAPRRRVPWWLRPNVGTALVLASVLGVLTFVLTSDGNPVTEAAADDDTLVVALEARDDTDIQPLVAPDADEPAAELDEPVPDAGESLTVADGEEPAFTNTAGLQAREAGGFGGGDAALSAVAASALITNMGPTEVGFVTNFPAVAYEWERIELDSPGTAEMGWLGELNGQIVNIGPTWDHGHGSAQTLVAHATEDGVTWEMVGSFDLPEDTWISRVVSDGQRVVAFGERWIPGRQQNQYDLYSTTDGSSWTTTSLDLDSAEGEHVYVHDAAMGPAGIAVVVQFETFPAEPPLVLSFDGYEVTLEHAVGSYSLTDTASAEVVVTGVIDEIFNWGGDGQSIYDPATGDVITTVPYEIWEQAWSEFYGPGRGGPPLPIPIEFGEPTTSPVVVIEYDGFLIEVDEMRGSFRVADAATGDEIAAGTLDELYQGRPPTFLDPATGEVVLAVSWDDWYRAEEEAYMQVEYEDSDAFVYRSRTELITSTDGEAWSSQTIADGQGGWTSYLVATSDGFVAMVTSYEEFGGERGTVWTMTGGEWVSTPGGRTDLWLHQVAHNDAGLIGVGDGAGGQAVWSSPDGISWVSEFATVPQDDGSHTWMADVSADSSGTTAALAVRELWSEYRPLVIEQELYTATFDEGDYALRVTETGSGDTVVGFTWQDLEEGVLSGAVSWDGEATTIDLGNGDQMIITDEEAYAASDTQYEQSARMGLSVFLNESGEWREAVVDVEGEMSGASQLLVVNGTIVISGTYWDGGAGPDFTGENTFVVLVGTPRAG